MKELKCTSTSCEFNNGCHCEAGIINIASNGVCKTKLKRKIDDIDSEYSRLEVASEFDATEGEDVLVQCDATDCVYNRDHMCEARAINICDGISKTRCMTKKSK